MAAHKYLRTKEYHRSIETAPSDAYVIGWQAILLTE